LSVKGTFFCESNSFTWWQAPHPVALYTITVLAIPVTSLRPCVASSSGIRCTGGRVRMRPTCGHPLGENALVPARPLHKPARPPGQRIRRHPSP